MSWFTDLFRKSEVALAETADLTAMASETRSPRAGRQQKCSVCHELGHKSPRHAREREAVLMAAISELEEGLAAANERAELTEAENRQLWTQIDKLQDRLRMAESLAQIVTYGEGTRI
jgi:DNA repair exonuclease SbcCD ATPase subunit